MQLLNIGCGSHIHPEWTNLDIAVTAPGVIAHDLRRGLPFRDSSYDVVYHSHVLEHLPPLEGAALLRECFRVLRPQGVIRIAVPDLEAVVRSYLGSLEAVANDGEAKAWANLDWARIELLDQVVRSQSGGQMLRYVTDTGIPNREFVCSRVGDELFESPFPMRRSLLKRLKLRPGLRRVREMVTLAGVSCLLGRRGYRALKEGLFRQSGEVHRWMFERASLRRALETAEFTQVSPCSAYESRIPGFADYGLDVVDGRARKPDSLFMEGTKLPALVYSARISNRQRARWAPLGYAPSRVS